MPQPGDIISDKYRILERLGAGAMGLVYSAVHIATEKRVALKWLNPAIASVPGSTERFEQEARATGRIHHPNVVAVHDVGEHEGQPYLAMEYLAGRTLRAHLAEAPEGRLPLEIALGWFFPILRGTWAAHAAGVLHRDLKPENVLLAESPDGLAPVPKVLDFGLARVRTKTSVSLKLSMPGSVLGTYQYMAPEQLKPNSALDERVDVYALGAMLYEMLSGGAPYRADNPVDLILQMHASEPPPLDVLVPALPGQLSVAVARALARDLDARFANVQEFALALEPFTQQRFRGAAQGSDPTPRGRRPSVDARSMGVATEVPKGVDEAASQAVNSAVPLSGRTASSAPEALPARPVAALALTPARRNPPRWLRAGIGLTALFLQPTTGGIRAEAPGPSSGIRAPSPPLAAAENARETPHTPSTPPSRAADVAHAPAAVSGLSNETDWATDEAEDAEAAPVLDSSDAPRAPSDPPQETRRADRAGSRKRSATAAMRESAPSAAAQPAERRTGEVARERSRAHDTKAAVAPVRKSSGDGPAAGPMSSDEF